MFCGCGIGFGLQSKTAAQAQSNEDFSSDAAYWSNVSTDYTDIRRLVDSLRRLFRGGNIVPTALNSPVPASQMPGREWMEVEEKWRDMSRWGA